MLIVFDNFHAYKHKTWRKYNNRDNKNKAILSNSKIKIVFIWVNNLKLSRTHCKYFSSHVLKIFLTGIFQKHWKLTENPSEFFFFRYYTYLCLVNYRKKFFMELCLLKNSKFKIK